MWTTLFRTDQKKPFLSSTSPLVSSRSIRLAELRLMVGISSEKGARHVRQFETSAPGYLWSYPLIRHRSDQPG